MSSPHLANAGGAAAAAPAPKVNKPDNSNFRQQRLVSWQPIMSPPHVCACLLVVAVAFIPVGIAVFFANKDASDFEFRYDDQTNCDFNRYPVGSMLFAWPNATSPQFTMGCETNFDFVIDKDLKHPVYLYYGLTNFYQNHRRFAKSRSEMQLAGKGQSGSSVSDCDPLSTAGGTNNMGDTPIVVDGETKKYGDFTYSPCGLVAWAMFNDTFALYRNVAGTRQLLCDGEQFSKSNNSALSPQGCHKDGITWSSDSDKFKTPDLGSQYWTADRRQYNAVPPLTTDPYLYNGWYAGEAGHAVPVVTDQDLQVWMRTAALPDFRKLYRVIDVDLPAGNYTMRIREFFPVSSFNGQKRFALTTVSWLGGKNNFLAIAYFVVGGLAAVLAIVFFLVYKVNGDRMQHAIDSLNELQ